MLPSLLGWYQCMAEREELELLSELETEEEEKHQGFLSKSRV